MKQGMGLMRVARMVTAGLVLVALGACANEQNANIPDPIAASPQPSTLQGGLAVKYFYHDIENVGLLERLTGQVQGQIGAPLPKLDYSERSGNALTSTARTRVGAEITGFMKFPQTGRYAIAANSNDGIRIFIGGRMVTDSPNAHPMERTPVGEIAVEGNVWYPVRILYFQRAGGWGLEFLWAASGQPLTIVPENALGHAG